VLVDFLIEDVPVSCLELRNSGIIDRGDGFNVVRHDGEV
jgi:hypothetical protein